MTLSGVVIGLGRQSMRDHLPALFARTDVQIVGVCDPDRVARTAYLARFPNSAAKVYASPSRMIEVHKPQFAVVAVPHQAYPRIISLLCERGIPFLKEKPFARNLSEAEAFLTIPRFSDLAMIATQRHFSGLQDFAWMQTTEIGRPYLFQSVYKLAVTNPHEGWRGSRTLAGGGCLLDMGYHLVDQVVRWFGLPDSIHAHISSAAVPSVQYSAEDCATVAFGYNSGRYAGLHGTLVVARSAGIRQHSYTMHGPFGSIVGDDATVTRYDVAGNEVAQTTAEDEDLTTSQHNFFLARVQHGQSFADTQPDHLASMRFIEACYATALVNS